MAVYTWGLGKNGQLCNGKTDNQLLPFHVSKCANGKKLGPVIDASCGAHFTAVLCCDGSLYTSGCGKYGRLGQGEEDTNILRLTPVMDVAEVKMVSCGFWHAACVNKNGQVYLWGHGKAMANEAERTSNVGVPKLLSFQPDLKIMGVNCGHNYTFAWTQDGQTFSWGRGQHGVLGHGSEQDVSSPQLVEVLKDVVIVDVGAGYSHCGLITSSGDLFMTGSGTDGALGFSPVRGNCALVPTKVSLTIEIKQVSCSKGEHHHHTLALTRSGGVMAWGDGYKGKLGLGDQTSTETPTMIPSEHFNNEKVVRVSAGGIHSAASTEDGSVYTWGCGSDGRLGHPEAEGHRYLFRSDIPRKVNALASGSKSPAVVSCSYYHMAAVVSR